MDQLLAFLNVINLLGFLPDLTLVEVLRWLLIALIANIVLDAIAAKRLFRGYVFVTHLDKVKKASGNRLPKLVWLLSLQSGVGAVLWDFYCQISYTKYFLDWPRETTLSKRMTRYLEGSPGWRRDLAVRFRDESLIDKFDARGKHL